MHNITYLKTGLIPLVLLIAGMALRDVRAEDYLGEIVVKGQQPIISALSNTIELQKDFLERRADHSLEQALEMVPNLNVRLGGQGVPRIDIRGLRTRHIKLLVNGIPFNSTFDGQFDPTLIPTSQIDRVKVTTGSTSELYGAGAMGVIDLLTRSTREDLLQVDTEFGSWNHRYMSIQAGGNQDKLDYYGNFTHRNRDYFKVAGDYTPASVEDGGKRLNSDLERNTGFGSLSYKVNEALQVGLNGSFMFGDYGVPPAVIDDPSNRFASRPSYERVDNQGGYSVQGSFNYDPESAYYLRGWAYTNHLRQDENSYDDASFNSIDDNTISGSYLTTTDTTITGLGLQGGYQFNPNSRLSMALDLHGDDWKQTGVIRDVAVTTTTTTGGGGGGGGGGSTTTSTTTYDLRQLDENHGITAVSLSAEYELTLFNDLDVVIGGGHHWQDPDGLGNETDYSFLAGLNYHLNSQLSLHGSWTRKIRMPSIRNLFDASRGNPGIKPERIKGFETGADYAFAETATLKVTGFYNDIDDFIQNDRVTKKFQNIEKAMVKGVELSLAARPLDKLDARLSVSLQDSADRSGSGQQQLTNTPGRIVSMDLDYEILYGIAAHLKLLNIADQYYYTRNAPYIKAKLDDATRLDLRLRWEPVATHISAYVGVDNVFDANYEDEYALPAPGRMVFAGVSWRR